MDKNIKDLLTFAEQGEYENYVLLGDIYDRGDGVEKDITKAFEYYSYALLKPEKIEEEGDALLYVAVGQRKLVGYGCKQNVAEALEYFEVALDHGDELPDGKFNRLAMMVSNIYKYGIGIKKDPAKALSILEKAYSKERFEDDEAIIAEMIKSYLHGEGTEKDTKKALNLFLENPHVEFYLAETNPSIIFELVKLVRESKKLNNSLYKLFMHGVAGGFALTERVYVLLPDFSDELDWLRKEPFINENGEVFFG